MALVGAPVQLVTLQFITGVDHVIAVPTLVHTQSIRIDLIEACTFDALGGRCAVHTVLQGGVGTAHITHRSSSYIRCEFSFATVQVGGACVRGTLVASQATLVTTIAIVGEVSSHTAGTCWHIAVSALQYTALAGIELGSCLALGALCGGGAGCT